MEAKLKHLEFIEAVIGRMATNSFLFKGWAITIAAALSSFAAVDSKHGLLIIALLATLMFWALDGYYLWLERCFVALYNVVASKDANDIDFLMKIDKSKALRRWFTTCWRPHLWVFYGAIIAVDVVGIFVIRSK
ncbi:MAG: hypothetical protein ACLP8S_10120 [Solirubrobacteraceae bacterium]